MPWTMRRATLKAASRPAAAVDAAAERANARDAPTPTRPERPFMPLVVGRREELGQFVAVSADRTSERESDLTRSGRGSQRWQTFVRASLFCRRAIRPQPSAAGQLKAGDGFV
jgi:hypothetical protein